MICETMKEPRKTYNFMLGLGCLPDDKRANMAYETSRVYFGVEHLLMLEMVNLESNWFWDWPTHPEIEPYLNEISLCD